MQPLPLPRPWYVAPSERIHNIETQPADLSVTRSPSPARQHASDTPDYFDPAREPIDDWHS